ncbi:DUF1566 domain-containing protein [Chakrabartyella piscis]|uniref:Lcl C-terminal domain-containing protein n=1 Tax=Chakrabartyella piscis TaxID=2918914 RepID=UPI0029589269|nr:DUF1566 domain-containing protein [Chakrabartyella piscis]
MKRRITALMLCTCVGLTACGSSTTETPVEDNSNSTTTTVTASTTGFSSPIVTTGQTTTYDGDGNVITTSAGDAFYGQDGDYDSLAFSFTLNDDGTTYDNNTGLTWITIPDGGKMTWEEAVAYCESLTIGGYDDWRLPTVEELFSISDFSTGWPYLDTDYFAFDETADDMTMAGGMQDGSPQGGSPQGGTGEMAAPEGDMAMQQGGGGQGGMTDREMPAEGMTGDMAMQGGREMTDTAGDMAMQQGGMGGQQAGMTGEREMMAEGSAPDAAMQQGGMGGQQGGMSGEREMPTDAPSDMGSAEMAPPMEGSADGDSMDANSKEDGQYWTAEYNQVEGDSRLGDIAFGVNHTTGHIKAYPSDTAVMGKYVRAVRGDVYGAEDYTDNGDGTVTDNASGLMWMEVDLGVAVDWEEALTLAESSEFADYDDWRLPDVKELQSIVNYDGSYPAINQDYFSCTELAENENYYFWTSTSAYFSEMSPDYDSAWYVAFGYTSHGAGAVRFSPKYEGSSALSEGEDNILNSVRLVRNVD